MFEFKSISNIKTNVEAAPVRSKFGQASVTADNIVAIIPRGEVIRNFIYTGALDEVAEKANLSLISVSPSKSMNEMLRETYGDVHLLEEFDERWIVRFQREIIATAHNRWLWSKAAQERARLRNAEARTIKQKAVWSIKKAVSYPLANRTGLNVLSAIERTSSRVFRTTDEYVKLMKKLAPALVFNGSHIHSRVATQAVQAAQWLGIPTATFIFSWDNLTSQGRIMLPYDYFLVWNETLKRQLLEMYEWIQEEQVFVTGTPQFDFHFQPKFYQNRADFCCEIGADSSRPIVLYSTGMANHMPGEPEIVEEIADMLKEIGGENSPQLLVRVYPKDLTGRFDELKGRRKDILFPSVAWEEGWQTPKFEDSFALVNTVRHADFGINVASTISLELCMFDKPAINVGYNPLSVDEKELSYATYYNFDHYRPVVESGAVEVAYNREQMRTLVRQAINEPSRRTNERKALINKMFGDTLDGNSAGRVARVLLEIAAGEKRK
ncbi:MAG: hypothetical protein ABJA66_09465 [Actinomycetota bacterium]